MSSDRIGPIRGVVYAFMLSAASTMVALSAPAQAPDFQWSGALRPGEAIEVRGVNGGIRAVASDEEVVRVEATRYGRRSDPTSVRIDVVEHGGGVTICAVYPDPPAFRPMNSCRPGGGGVNVQRNDVRVDFLIRVPAGIRLNANTVNGDIRADGLRSDVEAATVNGRLEIDTSGFVSSAATVNGDIDLALPADLNAAFQATTVNGRVESDFPIVVTGRIDRRNLRGTIGSGGPDLRVTTVNGAVRLRKH
jgi:putative adhesin